MWPLYEPQMAANTSGGMKTHAERRSVCGAVRRTGVPHPVEKDKAPRSSSPLTVYVALPCNIEQGWQAFPTIAWDDLEDCATRESDSLGSQVNESDGDERDFGDFALDFMADSSVNLESSLSPAELVPFQGCVIPPLTPQHVFSPEDGLTLPNSSCAHAQDGALWTGISMCQARMECAMEVNHEVPNTLHRRQSDPSEERNLHLRQLACRAKLLASVLEKLMAVREPEINEPARPREGQSTSPCKRQRLNDRCESSDSVEEMLRDVSTRCNAVLHATTGGRAPPQDSDTVPMYGSFPGLQTSICKERSSEVEEDMLSFRTSLREHSSIRTRVFPQGRAFTSGTRQGGYRFRWVPNHS
ncbi:multicilin isoform X2 [Phyllopteryx taeniolatus]|uniref:multicilin isoform X2 n=1 Tax=Phyllopteryx taeniolatus TaxID=161469 RepID=UPI002AD44C1F|nr:multicilin isoform X2 [Phyllopteryx taeniolatus]